MKYLINESQYKMLTGLAAMNWVKRRANKETMKDFITQGEINLPTMCDDFEDAYEYADAVIEYAIDDIQPECIILRDENTNETMKLKLKFIEEHFIHYYCNTCHSRQGSTIKNPITIHQWNFQHVSRQWLYTSITRATHFDNVDFMIDNKVDAKKNKIRQ